MKRIAVIPGDGAGIEVAEQALRVLEEINQGRRLDLAFQHFDFGAERYLKTGVSLPPGADSLAPQYRQGITGQPGPDEPEAPPDGG